MDWPLHYERAADHGHIRRWRPRGRRVNRRNIKKCKNDEKLEKKSYKKAKKEKKLFFVPQIRSYFFLNLFFEKKLKQNFDSRIVREK
jgi:hypothetical protein